MEHITNDGVIISYVQMPNRKSKSIKLQWEEQVVDTLLIFQVFPLAKDVEVGKFYHRYSTVSDGI